MVYILASLVSYSLNIFKYILNEKLVSPIFKCFNGESVLRRPKRNKLTEFSIFTNHGNFMDIYVYSKGGFKKTGIFVLLFSKKFCFL